MGRLSDFSGRRVVLLISMFGAVCGYALSAAAIVIGSPWLLLASRLPVGLAKQTATVSRSVVTDITSARQCSVYMGRLTASFAIGYAVGPLIGAWLAARHGDSAPCIAASLFFLLVLFPLVYFALPETRQACSSPQALKDTETGWVAPLLANRRLRRLLFVILLPEVALIMHTTTSMGNFIVARGVTKQTFSFANSLTSYAAVLNGAVGIPWLVRRGWGDASLMRLAQVSFVLLYTVLLVGDWLHPFDSDTAITNPSLLASCLLMGVVANLDRSIPPAMVSKRVDEHTQGGAMGALDLMSSCCRVFAPLLCGVMIDYCGVTSPFFFQSVLCLCGFWLVGMLQEKLKD